MGKEANVEKGRRKFSSLGNAAGGRGKREGDFHVKKFDLRVSCCGGGVSEKKKTE